MTGDVQSVADQGAYDDRRRMQESLWHIEELLEDIRDAVVEEQCQ